MIGQSPKLEETPAFVMLILTAEPSEQIAALQLLFQHLPNASALPRIRAAEQLLNEPMARLIVARQDGKLAGAVLAQVLPGATGVLWPPQATDEFSNSEQTEDALLREALAWLRGAGARLVQTILACEESHLADSLLRGGFVKPTRLRYLRFEATAIGSVSPHGEFASYHETPPEVFRETLLRSYKGTLDFPEIDGRRSLSEVLQGYQAAGFDPKRWWLKRGADGPTGVLMVSEIEPASIWDLTYVGVVPEARRRGHGRELVRKAMAEAQAGGAELLTVCVDERNFPALRLYAKLGFEEYDIRDVYLAFWNQ